MKNLQPAKPLIEQHFNEMEFVEDLPQPDATLKMSGAELKESDDKFSVQRYSARDFLYYR